MGKNQTLMKPLSLLLLSLSIGWCAWNISGASLLLFIALVPFFLGLSSISDCHKKNGLIAVLYLLVFKVVWVAGQVYWLKDVTFDTFFAIVLTHSLLFVLILTPSVYFIANKKTNLAIYFLLIGWILFEYLKQSIALLSPFYILGTSLGEYPSIIRGYRWIGIEGGSVWILLVNFFVYKTISSWKDKVQLKKNVVNLGITVVVPLLLSVVLSVFKNEGVEKVRVAALHTDFNPVNPYYAEHPDVIIDSLWKLSEGVDRQTELLVWPETVITNLGWMQELHQHAGLDSLQKKIAGYPNLKLVFGANTNTLPTDKTDEKLNYSSEHNFYYYVHNLAFSLDTIGIQYRSKEIFVPFQEEIPYVRTFPFLKKMITVVGNPNYYTQLENDTDVHYTGKGASYLPLLCYEICYPLYTAKATGDVGFIAMMGNEHWNTSEKGSEIYFSILTAIAIQNNCAILKSSNNGISVIMNGQGEVLEKKAFGDTGLIQGIVSVKDGNCLYTYISGYSYLAALILFPVLLFRNRRKKQNNN